MVVPAEGRDETFTDSGDGYQGTREDAADGAGASQVGSESQPATAHEAVKARALSFVAPRRVEVGEVDLPELEAGQVLVRTQYSGISSGTEMLAYRGEIDPKLSLDERIGALSGTFTYPFRYGYSAVGTVEQSAGALPEGARVFAFHPHQDLFVIAPGALVVNSVDPRLATLYPLVETALQVCLDTAPRYAELVVVVGLGVVGMLAAKLLQLGGAEVLGSEPQAARRKTAKAMGVPAVTPEELRPAVQDVSRGRGADHLVEASGNAAALASSLDLLAREGTAVVCSWYGMKPVPLLLGGDFHRRRLCIRSSQVSTLPASIGGRWDRERRSGLARRLLDELPLSLLARHEFAFERAPEAYAAIDRGQEDLIHAALRYP